MQIRNEFIRQNWQLLLIGILLLICVRCIMLDNWKSSMYQPVVTVQDKNLTLPPKNAAAGFSAPYDHKYRFAHYVVQVNKPAFTTGMLRFTPDDCIRDMTINGAEVDLSEYPEDILCRAKGFTLELAQYLKTGPNTLKLTVENLGDDYGLDVKTGPSYFLVIAIWLSRLTGLFMIYVFCSRCNMSKPTIAILSVAFCYYLYWLNTYPDTSITNDVRGHLAYTEHMLTHWINPYEYYGGEEFQPPLYYYVAARFYTLATWTAHITIYTALRVLSLPLYMIFCIYGLRALRKSIAHENLTYYVAAILFVFWPSAVLFATRINNDIAMYAAWGVFYYYLICWYEDRSLSMLQTTIAFMGFVFMVKTNAVIPFGILGLTGLYALYARRIKWSQLFEKRTLVAGGFLAFGICANFGRMIYQKIVHNHDASDVYFGESADQPITWNIFLSFDPAIYIKSPYMLQKWEPTYWNSLFKTMIYGEFDWHNKPLPYITNILLVFLLLFIVSTLVRYLCTKKESFQILAPYLIGCLFPICGSIIFFVSKQMWACQDFRFIVPMLIPLVILFAKGMESLGDGPVARKVYWLGIALALALPAFAIPIYVFQKIT